MGRLANCEDYVVNTGVFYVFVADLYRHATILSKEGQSLEPLKTPESLLVAPLIQRLLRKTWPLWLNLWI